MAQAFTDSPTRPVKYPYIDGDYVVIGPGCFATMDRQVLNWDGDNYEPQRVSLRARFRNWRLRRDNAD